MNQSEMESILYNALNIGIVIIIAILSYLKLKIRGGKSILFLSLALLICHIASLQHALVSSSQTETIRIAAVLLSTTLAATALFTFSLEYTNRSHWIGLHTVILLSLIPLLTQILFWLPDDVQSNASLLSSLSSPILMENINILYRYSLITAAVWLIGRTYYFRRSIFNFQFWVVLTGPLIALIAQGLILVGADSSFINDISLASFNISLIGFSINIYGQDSNAGLLIRRGSVVENMEDGWIVLDTQNSIVDLNQATATIIDRPRKELYGKSITSILNDFPDLAYMLDNSQEIEMERTVKVSKQYRYLNIRVSALHNEINTLIGHLVIWRDITDRRRVEDARQQARDEMFVLLNAISSAASQTANLNEFLSDAIYQVIYPFRSQAVFAHILDERSNPEREPEFYLAAQLGLSTENVRKLNKLPAVESWFEQIGKGQQHFLLENPYGEYVPESVRALNMACLLVLPLVVRAGEENKLLGLLFLGRNDGPLYEPDEVVRLVILADQIAKLIDSDRRRKLAISLLERQRLMRDIHDSVSQKLYGLVTLTEAAHAALEAESKLDFAQVLSRIGENARQAVKELRLFLFQLQPIDLEKEGLISVLHHRLAAVEGRADIKVRFMADEPIYLSKRKEIALYFIAQEALNNILRHAQAESVSVTLKQGYKYVTFQVADDGCGFEQDKLEQGGLGLKNIKERVKQENGKLKISSKPNKGTIIKVIFEMDVPTKSSKNS